MTDDGRNPVCLTCANGCKQGSGVRVVYCPNYRPDQGTNAPKADGPGDGTRGKRNGTVLHESENG